jgi:hypothetical protein
VLVAVAVEDSTKRLEPKKLHIHIVREGEMEEMED